MCRYHLTGSSNSACPNWTQLVLWPQIYSFWNSILALPLPPLNFSLFVIKHGRVILFPWCLSPSGVSVHLRGEKWSLNKIVQFDFASPHHVVFVDLVMYLWPKTMSSLSGQFILWTKLIVSLQNSYVETLSPNVMVFGYGSFGKELSLNEIMKANPYKKYLYMKSHQIACFLYP